MGRRFWRRFLVLGLAMLAGPVAALTPAEVERRLGHSGGRAAMPLRFRPQRRGAKGTNGVEVVISDLSTGASVVMMPTYDWLGGRE